MTMARQQFIPFGRIEELRSRPDADRIAITIPQRSLADYAYKVYASRAAMRHFCKPGSSHHALIKDDVVLSMIANPNMECAAK